MRNLVGHVLALDDFAKDSVLVVQPRRCRYGEEELAPVGSRPGVGHGELSGLRMLQRRMKLIGEFVSWPAHSAALRAATLNHELRNHAMEDQSVVERSLFLLSGLFIREFFGAFGKPDEIRNRFWRFVFEQAHYNVSL